MWLFHRRQDAIALHRASAAAQASAKGIRETRAIMEDAARDKVTLAEMRQADHIGPHIFGNGAGREPWTRPNS